MTSRRFGETVMANRAKNYHLDPKKIVDQDAWLHLALLVISDLITTSAFLAETNSLSLCCRNHLTTL